MPKPILPSGLSAEMPAGKAASKILNAKTDEVLGCVDLAMAGDVDAIHDVRVAVKRLRDAITVFRRLIPKRRRASVLPLVEEFNDALGQVRERDVLQTDAAWVADNAPAAGKALGPVGEGWAQERAQALDNLIRLWDRLRNEEHIIRRLRRLARATARSRRPDAKRPLDQFAYSAITARAERVRERLAEARRADTPEALHRLRIAVKRLKYTMEPFSPILPAADQPYEVVADVQESLGLAHDFDVLAAALAQSFQQSGVATSRPPRDALRALEARRDQLYAAAREAIGNLDDGWYHELLDSID
jgi:triphosphatase